ncbi:MAG TPA: DHA2 family efflux MFS transporter permease subunit [Candidatus Ligilactobacillus excrementigallinarum]|uniref:DHA2 family efflux MFS transporter permease subunit n=1 Tax=Candidatus Ligilactobacillus excrementigallinarum TaxID=2838641 RepID=A0A9D2A9P0_9LACO|nr:DHA2 family efflux MFS transporter permease subunit [Candidatus Ligilactobacillus excrementigallinarum]
MEFVSEKLDIAHTINPRTRIIVSAILLISNFICLMSQTMMVTALPVIQTDMHQAMTTVQWLTTGYTLLIGIVTPLSSNMYEKFTNRQVFLGTIGLFTVGTALGCVAQNFWMLLLARLIQAAAGGLLLSFEMTVMVTIYPPEKRGTIMGISALVVAFGPAIGPTLAGFVLSIFGWRYLFILILPIMILIFIIGAFVFPNFSKPRNIKIDMLSVVISLAGSALALASLTVMQQQLALGLVMLIVGLILVFIFVKRQLKLKNPMLKVTIFKVRSFRLMTLIGILAFMVLLGTEQMVSIFAQNVTHLTSMQAGMVLLPGAALNAITAAFVGRLYDEFGPKTLVLSGSVLMIIGTIPFVFIQASMSVWMMTVAYAVRMMGNALVFSPVMSEVFNDLAPEEVSHGTALNNALRQVAGSVSVTLLIVVSSIPHSFVLGMQLSMWITLILTVAMLGIFIHYLKVQKNR